MCVCMCVRAMQRYVCYFQSSSMVQKKNSYNTHGLKPLATTNGQEWTIWKPESRNSILVLHVGGESPNFGVICHLAKHFVRWTVQQPEHELWCDIRGWWCRHWLNIQCHNALTNLILSCSSLYHLLSDLLSILLHCDDYHCQYYIE